MIKFLYPKGHSENWTVCSVEVDILNWSIHSSSLCTGFYGVCKFADLSPRNNVRSELPGKTFLIPKCLLERMDEFLDEYFRTEGIQTARHLIGNE